MFLVTIVPSAKETAVFGVTLLHTKQQSLYLHISTYFPLMSVVGLYRSQVKICTDGSSEDNTDVRVFQGVIEVFKWLYDYAS
jgi:hypothetical protein